MTLEERDRIVREAVEWEHEQYQHTGHLPTAKLIERALALAVPDGSVVVMQEELREAVAYLKQWQGVFPEAAAAAEKRLVVRLDKILATALKGDS